MSYKGNSEKKVTNGIIVTCANGGRLVSTATDVINYQGLPPAATPCHKFPDRQLVDPLLSLGKLATHGCRIAFAGDKVTVTNPQGTVVLIGSKPPHRNVYTVPLPIGQARSKLPVTINFPTLPASTQKISGDPSSSHNVANQVVTTTERKHTGMKNNQTPTVTRSVTVTPTLLNNIQQLINTKT